MIYQVYYYYGGSLSGISYFSNKKDALKSIKKHTKIYSQLEYEQNGWDQNQDYEAEINAIFKTPKTKKEIISTFNIYGRDCF